MSSLPNEPIPLTVVAVTPVSEPLEGRNVFRVEARLEDAFDRLRPGMEGVAKIDIEERSLGWIWAHKLIDWLRIQFWSLWP